MHNLMYIPFKFEDGGTQVIYYGPEAYEPLKMNNDKVNFEIKKVILHENSYYGWRKRNTYFQYSK